jgi:hypothetical protein
MNFIDSGANMQNIYVFQVRRLLVCVLSLVITSSVFAESPSVNAADVKRAFPQLHEEEQVASLDQAPNKFADMAIELFYTGKIMCLSNPNCPDAERQKLQQRQAELEKEHSAATLERVVKGLWHKCNSDHKCPREEKTLYKAEVDHLRASKTSQP